MPTSNQNDDDRSPQEELDKRSEEVRQLLAATNKDVEDRYKVGRIVREVREDRKKTYGKNAVAKMAKKVGESPSTLYEHKSVNEAWSREAFRDLMKKRDRRFDKPLSWSHLVFLSGIDEAGERKEWVDKALENGWSVRALKKAHREAKGEPKLTPLQLMDAYSRCSKSAFTRLDTKGEELLDACAGGSDLPDEMLAKARKARAELESGVETERDRLQALIKQLSTADDDESDDLDDDEFANDPDDEKFVDDLDYGEEHDGVVDEELAGDPSDEPASQSNRESKQLPQEATA